MKNNVIRFIYEIQMSGRLFFLIHFHFLRDVFRLIPFYQKRRFIRGNFPIIKLIKCINFLSRERFNFESFRNYLLNLQL